MMGIIYLTRCLVNGKLYVGLHTKGDKDYLGSGMFLLRAIKKYGKENFIRADLDTFLELAEGQAKERRWIAALNSKVPAGYNLNDGGEGSFNPSEETRAKMRAAKLGKLLSDAHKAKISAKMSVVMTGKHPSDKTRAKMSMAQKGNFSGRGNKGNRHTNATKAKMSKAHIGLKYKKDKEK